jgi:hypothetical protein
MAGFVPQLVPREQLQPANVLLSMSRAGLAVLGPGVAATLVVTSGPGWALAVDAVSWFVAAAFLLRVHIPARVRTGDEPSVLTELREGWRYFTGTTWLWAVVLAFSVLNAIHEGGLNTLGPVLAKQSSIGEHGWGLIMSAQAVGLLAMTLLMMRFSLRRPLFFGMLGCACFGLPMVMMGAHPNVVPVMVLAFVAGAGIEIFTLGWNLAMQENIPEEMLSRAYSYDALGSFVAIPFGQLAFGPLATASGIQRVLLVGGVVYVVIALVTLTSRSVRSLGRAPSTTSR